MTGPLVVTGGTGLLGSAIRQRHPQAIFLSTADGDLRDLSIAHRVFAEIRPARVLHLAARVGGVKANATNNCGFFEDNVLINTAVLSAARRSRVPKLVAVLSSCAFPLFVDRPTTEADLQAALPYDGNAGYGYAKRMLDQHIRLAAKDEGLQWTTLTPVTMYGPHDSFDSEHGHVVGSLIRRCHEALTMGKPYIVWGSGRAVRQFVFVQDVARLMLEALERPLESTTTIVAPDNGITIKALAELVAMVMGYNGPIAFDQSQPEGVLVKCIDSTEFASRFQGFQFMNLKDGLERTVQWFRSHASPAAQSPCIESSVCHQS